MKKIVSFLSGIAACLAVSTAQAAAAGDVTAELRLAAGTVRTSDRDRNGVLAFKGIPYAAPPTGDQRWRSPLPAPRWRGSLDASKFGPSCPASFPQENTAESEDCLSVNVWTSAKSTKDRLPVMVWIPGGGFQSSLSSRHNADGAVLATKQVVVVSFNYRVGVFGFLAHPALDREGNPSGNFGLQDQIAALKWVKDHIAHFGGDPDNVTIFGESAGAMSVGLLMTSPKARGLFAKAIGQSGAFWDSASGSIPTHEEARARGLRLAERSGAGGIAGLRALSAAALQRETAWIPGNDPLRVAFSPSIDRHVITDNPAKVFGRGEQAPVPLLAGWNAAEGATFKRMLRWPTTYAEYRARLLSWFGPETGAQLLTLYPADTEKQLTESVEALSGDLFISQQTWEWLHAHSRTSRSPVYGYHFSMRSPYTPVPAHTTEIDYVFGTLKPHWLMPSMAEPSAVDHALSGKMMGYWSNFARTGNPNGAGLPNWPRYRTRNSQVMRFDTLPAASLQNHSERYRLIASLRDKHGRFPAAWRTVAVPPAQ